MEPKAGDMDDRITGVPQWGTGGRRWHGGAALRYSHGYTKFERQGLEFGIMTSKFITGEVVCQRER